MRKRKTAMTGPAVGDHVLIGYGAAMDPHFWWISDVAWTDGQTILIFDGTGSHPTRAPHLGLVENVVTFGTKDHCLETMLRANRVARDFDDAIRAANIALGEAKDAVREAVLATLTPAAPEAADAG